MCRNEGPPTTDTELPHLWASSGGDLELEAINDTVGGGVLESIVHCERAYLEWGKCAGHFA